MMRTLLFAALRRQPLLTLNFAFMAANFCRTATEKAWPVGDIGLALGAGLILSSTGDPTFFDTREIVQLPVSRREIWLARWWKSVAFSATLAAGAASLGLWFERPGDWTTERLALTWIYCVALLGFTRWFLTTSLGRRGEEPATKKTVGLAVPWMLVIFALPLTFGNRLPHRFADFGPVSGMLVLAGLVCTVLGYLYTPEIKPRLSRRVPSVQPRVASDYVEPEVISDEERARRRERYRQLPLWIRAMNAALGIRPDDEKGPIADRLNGLRLLAWLEMRRDLVMVVTALIFGIFVWSFGFFTGDPNRPTWIKFNSSVGLLPFSHAAGRAADIMILCVFATFMSMGMHGRMAQLRMFRALPLSKRGLASILIALSCLSALSVWTCLFALHFVSTWSLPASLRFDVFFAAFAAAALVQSSRLVFQGSRIWPPVPHVTAVGVIGFLWYAAFTWPLISPGVSVLLANGIALSAGYAITSTTIARASRIYARPASS